MSIRPIDMQIVIQKTQEIHSAKQQVVNKLDNDLLRAQDKTNLERSKQKSQVLKSEKSLPSSISRKQREEGNGQGNAKDKKRRPRPDVVGVRFDARI